MSRFLLHRLFCTVVLLSFGLEVPFYHIRSASNSITFLHAQSTDGRIPWTESNFQKQWESSPQGALPSSRLTLPSSEGDTKELPSRKHKDIFANMDKKLVRIFTTNEIKIATENFSYENLLGIGGNGEVYRGKLDDTEVAIKCPSEGNNIGTHINHIFNEIEIHGKVKHPSIVQLLGYGLHLHKPHVVYEYMSKGSLFDHLHLHCHHHHVARGLTFLTWRRRLTIAHQIVQGLVYLHNYSVPRIFHVDVKSANILFDNNLNAKLSDFGHAQIIKPEKSHISMPAEGTPALIDPYWRETGNLTDKTDVYSFGILLVELLTSQKAVDLKRGKDGVILVEKRKLMESVDPLLKEGMTEVAWKQIMAIGSLAVNCMSHHINGRPSMKEVAEHIQRVRNWDGYFSSYASLY